MTLAGGAFGTATTKTPIKLRKKNNSKYTEMEKNG